MNKMQWLVDFENSSELPRLEKLVLRYTVAMTQTPVHVPDALFSELRRFFSERQLVELTVAIAWENYSARVAHAFGLEAEGFSEGSCCVLPHSRHEPATVGT